MQEGEKERKRWGVGVRKQSQNGGKEEQWNKCGAGGMKRNSIRLGTEGQQMGGRRIGGREEMKQGKGRRYGDCNGRKSEDKRTSRGGEMSPPQSLCIFFFIPSNAGHQ